LLQQLLEESLVCYFRIFLIDHAWTYRPDQARDHLSSIPSLLSRMAALMDVDVDDRPQDDVIEDVLTSMWRCAECMCLLLPTTGFSLHYLLLLFI